MAVTKVRERYDSAAGDGPAVHDYVPLPHRRDRGYWNDGDVAHRGKGTYANALAYGGQDM